MADKTVGELPRASTVTTTDLFVLEQAGQAKSLTGQVLINDLAEALDGHGGISSITLNDDYTLTFTMSDETTVTTTSVRGATGAKGDKGTDGRAITGIEKIDTSGLVDTYKISFSDNTSVNFTVTNGSSIQSIAKTGTSGLVDTYTVTLTDDTTSTFTVTNGNGISSIALQSGTHAAGTTDTYKITFDNGEFATFSVYNGMNGSGSVVSVNEQSPDVNGNVSLTGANIPVSQDDGTTLSAKIAAKQSPTQNLDAETALADEDSFPFYDASASANKRTLWSNIVAKLKSLFLPLAGGTLTGIVTILKADDAYISIRNSTNDTRCALEAYNGTVGLYAGHLGKWLLKNDGTTTTVDNTIPATAGAVKAENLASDAVKLSFTNTSVAASQFVSDSTYTDFPYRALVSLSSAVTGDMIPEVVFNAADAASGIFAPVAQSTGGGIMLYASEKPSAAVTIPTIILWR